MRQFPRHATVCSRSEDRSGGERRREPARAGATESETLDTRREDRKPRRGHGRRHRRQDPRTQSTSRPPTRVATTAREPRRARRRTERREHQHSGVTTNVTSEPQPDAKRAARAKREAARSAGTRRADHNGVDSNATTTHHAAMNRTVQGTEKGGAEDAPGAHQEERKPGAADLQKTAGTRATDRGGSRPERAAGSRTRRDVMDSETASTSTSTGRSEHGPKRDVERAGKAHRRDAHEETAGTRTRRHGGCGSIRPGTRGGGRSARVARGNEYHRNMGGASTGSGGRKRAQHACRQDGLNGTPGPACEER